MFESAKRRQSRKKVQKSKAKAKKEAGKRKSSPNLKTMITRFVKKV
ncbi:hypothetical protein J7J90_03165 [Candidatus Micrarchaeota archaeon]|nr:hypothetical protein [Candidatus Micrarchaeota archaeon]